jgi:hypothetical protein
MKCAIFENMSTTIKIESYPTSTYDQICDGCSLILPHLSIAISMKADIFFVVIISSLYP